ncbi:MAG: 4'-phosphopantetheinyl transferase superfamily protein [Thaumarchaeota archaeon]|nr:4'-phosphopantetheinyl transferase superfamily protein [Nitrosopumilaceae archaeon]NDF25300.1 4'-phosphopantetheinyl transferase superfamily protein [Nitrososphaerota archaeon]
MMCNISIGIDISDVGAFREVPYKSKSSFYKKLFNQSEIKYCLKYKNYFEHFAAKFAIKEAVKKSISEKITMLDIETYHVQSKPHVKLKKFQDKYVFRVSVSHEKDLAIAVVISESRL